MSDFILPAIITLGAVAVIAVAFSLTAKIKNSKLRDELDDNFGKIPIREFGVKFDSISSYWKEMLRYEKKETYIDEITWNDLDMDKVYSRINNCNTSVGEEYLYAKLHDSEETEENLLEREEMLFDFDSDDDLAKDLLLILARAGKINYNGVSEFCYDISSKRLDKTWIYPILAVLPILSLGLFFIDPLSGFLGVICAMALNGIVHYVVSLKIEKELTAIRYLSILLWCAKQLSERLKLSEHNYPVIDELDEAYESFKRVGGKMSSFAKQKMSDLDFIIEYYQIITLSGIRNYNRIINLISKHTEDLRRLFNGIGEIDIALSILSYRKSLDIFCRPEFTEEFNVEVEDIFHPLIEKPITNTVSIPKYSLISGSNASGKSTFIKSVALNAILAQTIYTCTAKSFKFKHAHVMTSMAIRDDVTSGDSYFIAEIKSLKRIVDIIPKRHCLCLVDEILRGTNTIERIAASTSVLENIAKKDCVCIVATHDIELTSILGDIYKNYHFSEQITNQGVEFDYTIRDGATQTRNAIYLLDYLGFNKDLIKHANDLVSHFEESGNWQ